MVLQRVGGGFSAPLQLALSILLFVWTVSGAITATGIPKISGNQILLYSAADGASPGLTTGALTPGAIVDGGSYATKQGFHVLVDAKYGNWWKWAPSGTDPGWTFAFGPQGTVSDNYPNIRSGALTWVAYGDVLYYYGGVNSDGTARYADLWSWVASIPSALINIVSNTPNAILAGATGGPGPLSHAYTWTTTVGGVSTLWMFGGMAGAGAGTYSANLWKYVTGDSGGWTQVTLTGTGPDVISARAKGYAWAYSATEFYIFGGETGTNTYSDELFKITAAGAVTKISSTGATTGFPTQYDSGGYWPSARASGKSWVGFNNDQQLWMFGGVAASGERSDFWAYDVLGSQWLLKNGLQASESGNTPVAIGSRTAPIVWPTTSTIYIYGGSKGTAQRADFWKFVLNTDLLELEAYTSIEKKTGGSTTAVAIEANLLSAATKPPMGSRGSTWTSSDAQLFLRDGSYGALWSYNSAKTGDTWTRVGAMGGDLVGVMYPGDASNGNSFPSARRDALTWTVGTGPEQMFYFYGGWALVGGAVKYYADLWSVSRQGELTLLSNTANAQGPANGAALTAPPAVGAAVTWTSFDGSALWFWGGSTSTDDNALSNTMWRYKIGEGWTKISFTSTSNPSSRRHAHFWLYGSTGDYYLYGGYTASGQVGDMWRLVLGTATAAWFQIYKDEGQIGATDFGFTDGYPGPRWGGVSFVGTDGGMYLYGGNAGSTSKAPVCDMWAYLPSESRWEFSAGKITGCTGDGNTAPRPLAFVQSWYHGGVQDELFTFGGEDISDNDAVYGEMFRIGDGDQSDIESDPIIRGFNGKVFDFPGAPFRVFNMLSLPDLQVNSYFVSSVVPGETYTGAIGIRQGGVTFLRFDLHRAYMYDNDNITNGERAVISNLNFPLEPVMLPNGGIITRPSLGKVQVDFPMYSIHMKRIWETRDDVVGTIHYIDTAFTLKTTLTPKEQVNGLLGQTYMHNATTNFDGTWEHYAAPADVDDVFTDAFAPETFKYDPNSNIVHTLSALHHTGFHK